MTFIVPGVARFTIQGSQTTQSIFNVLDMQIDTTGSILSREDAIEAQAGILINEWSDSVLIRLHASYSANQVSWVDLNSEDGVTGSRNSTAQEVWPQNGAIVGESLPANVSLLVRKATTSRRGARSGRMYVAPLGESESTGNQLLAAAAVAWQTNMTAFLGDINQDPSGTFDYSSQLAVVHILTRDVDGNPLTGDFTGVSQLSVQEIFATQRRRLRD